MAYPAATPRTSDLHGGAAFSFASQRRQTLYPISFITYKSSNQLQSSDYIKMAGKFEPKTPVQLDPPKDDPISAADLAQADGMRFHNHRQHALVYLYFDWSDKTN